ncbi:MAG: helix-turn-helix domain-containing protein [Bdellovibrionales bacterium]|nr:helix-turn-helix domain-containing protein [Bdellovibrionales bacterium]
MGENIRLARLRRRLSASLTASRAGISRPTLRAIERGDPKVTLGAYAIVLMTLGLDKELAGIARNDILGRKLQDVNLPVRVRAPRTRKLPHEPG